MPLKRSLAEIYRAVSDGPYIIGLLFGASAAAFLGGIVMTVNTALVVETYGLRWQTAMLRYTTDYTGEPAPPSPAMLITYIAITTIVWLAMLGCLAGGLYSLRREIDCRRRLLSRSCARMAMRD